MNLPNGKILILFDGYCHLCSRTVRLILKFDKKEKFVFAPLYSSVGSFFKAKWQIPESVDSVILIEEESCFVRSEAALRIARHLGGFFKLFLIFRIFPVSWRDKLYDWIARNRFRWFGQRETCLLPTPDQQHRFL